MTTDRISLAGLRCFGKHGVEPEERERGQDFIVDVDCWLDLSKAGRTDSISDTIDYTDLIGQVRSIVEDESHLLLESLAARLVEALLRRSKVSSVSVAISKPAVAERLGLEKVTVVVSGSRS